MYYNKHLFCCIFYLAINVSHYTLTFLKPFEKETKISKWKIKVTVFENSLKISHLTYSNTAPDFSHLGQCDKYLSHMRYLNANIGIERTNFVHLFRFHHRTIWTALTIVQNHHGQLFIVPITSILGVDCVDIFLANGPRSRGREFGYLSQTTNGVVTGVSRQLGESTSHVLGNFPAIKEYLIRASNKRQKCNLVRVKTSQKAIFLAN